MRTRALVRSVGILAVGALGLLLTSCVTPVGQACTASSPNIVCRQFAVGGLTRKIYYHVSTQAPPTAGRPLVLYFHGDGGTGNANMTGLYSQTDPDGALVVQLDGPNNVAGLNRGSTAWSFFMNGSTPDDVGFAKTVVDDVENGSLGPVTPIDRSRVYAVGASRGGFMIDTLLMDPRTTSTFTAVVNVAGNFYCESGDTVCPTRTGGPHFPQTSPVLHIHGDNDGVVPPPAHLPNPVTGSINWPWPLAQFVDAYGCSGTFAYRGTVTPIGGKASYRYSSAGTCGQDDQLVLVQGGGHVPSGWESPAWSYLRTKTAT